jgi:hypothetical protein
LKESFQGFIEVFVSSDGTSIPVGANFLKRIEDGLVNCVGAIYLISPVSVKRTWINFELGAVWIRNTISIRSGGNEVPTLPFCHSNMTPSNLPQPIGNLNAIVANQAAQLEIAFRSLQSAVGGKGSLRTDFDELAQKVVAFEREYTLGTTVKSFLSMLGDDTKIKMLLAQCERLPVGTKQIDLGLGFIPTELVQKIAQFEENELKGRIKLTTNSAETRFGSHGVINGADVLVSIDVNLVTEFKEML